MTSLLAEFLPILRRLNYLEVSGQSVDDVSLTSAERRLAIRMFRKRLPVSLLAHHDEMMAALGSSLVRAYGKICGSCGMPVSLPGKARKQESDPLGICPHCRMFIDLVDTGATGRMNKIPTRRLHP